MTMAKNYYEILDVDRDATPDEIKKSFRKLAKKYHPDISKETDAEARMQEINTAYDTLSHEERKAEYDYALGSVENYLELITLAQRKIIAEKLLSVLSLRIAIRLNSFNLQK